MRWITTALDIVGVCFLASGAFLVAGTGAALFVVGAVLLAFSYALARRVA